MQESSNSKSSLPILEGYFIEEQNNIVANQDWKQFVKSYERLSRAAHKSGLPLDPKFNAVHWAFDVNSLCKQIVYGYCWMKAYARYYREKVTPNSQPSHVDSHVSYFADNCITRINSCRDKLALMVWAYYCPFNPENREEILDYTRIIDRLKFPVKFGITIKKQDVFLKSLEKLEGKDFKRIQKYRHLKIHRMEPRVEIYGVDAHHGWSYMVPILHSKDIKKFDRELSKRYPDKHREIIKKGCYINGILFDKKKVEDSIWAFDELEGHIKSCSVKLLKTSSECFQALSNRAPLRMSKKKA